MGEEGEPRLTNIKYHTIITPTCISFFIVAFSLKAKIVEIK